MSDEKAAEASECGPLRSSSASARPESTDRCVPMGRNDAGRGEGGGRAVAFHREPQVTDGQKRLETMAGR